MEDLVLFDIDGTLADAKHRLHFIADENRKPLPKKDWEGFFNAQHLDTPRHDIVRVLNMYRKDPEVTVALLTARGEEWREMTEAWLTKHNIKYDFMVMRPLENRTDDDNLKINQIKDLEAKGYKIIGFYEDRMRICDAARAYGLTVFQVAKGEF